MATQAERILAETKATIGRGRAVATGIGVFLVVIDENGNPLLRRRLEKDSLYAADLSGKWEMTGGGMELAHFANAEAQEPNVSRYQWPILQALIQELEEEAGLKLVGKLVGTFTLVMAPAFLDREYKREGEPRETIDVAFSTPMPLSAFEQTEKFSELVGMGGLMFVPREKLGQIEIVSPRTRFLIQQALEVYELIS